ncbi:MAG: SMC-Scp complex subunit ScpB [Spirochaetaceae bacterium]|jgi:segregation and condensation protein B|nr:SMC-Scp complex subunit ScpB [Spirochaetaceae bacterium]
MENELDENFNEENDKSDKVTEQQVVQGELNIPDAPETPACTDKQTAIVEAILYLESDPLDAAAIGRISGLPKETVEEAFENLKERYSKEDSGVELCYISGGAIISPKREYWEALRERYGKKNEGKLSRAAMETLAIIAYSQPITRSEVESIRGVQADTNIRMLKERGLIEETGKKDVPGKPVQYGTTKDFLRFFRLQSIADLPKLSDSEAGKFVVEE